MLYPAVLAVAGLLQPLAAVPVRVLAWDGEVAAMKLAFVSASGSKPIESMHPSKRTGVYQLDAVQEGLSVEVLGKQTADGKPCREPLSIPANSKRPLLLVLPDERVASGIRLHLIDDGEEGFPWGSTRFINATGRKLVFVAEKKAVEIPDSWLPVLVTPGGESRNMEVQVYFRDQREKAFYSAVWQYTKEIRTLVFMVPGTDPRLGPVAMKMVPEDHRVAEMASRATGR